MSIIDPAIVYGKCARCGGALTNPHICMPMVHTEGPPVTDTTPSRLSSAIRLYAAAMNLENKDLAKVWECSESTVSRFLNGKQWPDGQTVGRILSWLMS